MSPHDTTHNHPRIAHAPVELSEPGSLIAAIPAVMGYYPDDGVVLFALYQGAMLLTTHFTQDSATNRDFAATLAESALNFTGAHLVACIIGDTDTVRPPRQELLAAHLITAFGRNGQELDVYGVPAISAGQRWFHYTNTGRGGELPDPEGTPLPLVAARNEVVYADPDALRAMLRPDPDESLRHRGELLSAVTAQLSTQDYDQLAQKSFALVQSEVERAAHRHEPLTDQEIAELAFALSDHEVRDRCLTFAMGPHAAAAERLWTELVRTCPEPERAEPAVLLALFAYLRGSILLAVIAQRHAENVVPDHRMANLLRTALDSGAPPSMIRKLAEKTRRRYDPTEPNPADA